MNRGFGAYALAIALIFSSAQAAQSTMKTPDLVFEVQKSGSYLITGEVFPQDGCNGATTNTSALQVFLNEKEIKPDETVPEFASVRPLKIERRMRAGDSLRFQLSSCLIQGSKDWFYSTPRFDVHILRKD